MPQIIVTAGHGSRDETTVMLRERVNVSDFESERFGANLVERLGWAVLDATEAEHEEPEPEHAEPTAPRQKRTTQHRTRRITGERRRDREREPQLEPIGSA
jgi:hypothetical protein